MTFSKIGRMVSALVATAALGLGMTACGGGTVGYMWVLGTQYNQISSFKIDQYTGNLTPGDHTPYASGGSNPAYLLVKPGGRFVYVINSGSGGVGVPGAPGYMPPTSSGIAVFSVGGNALLTYQQTYSSQGTNPVWATFDSSGNYLYVLDKYAPDYATVPSGSITAFAVASDTGRLTLVPNQSVLINNIPTSFFRVGLNPIMTKVGSGNCLFTLSDSYIYPYAFGSNGQLTTVATGTYSVGSTGLTSINTSLGSSSSFIYVTAGPTNQVFSLQSGGSACALTPISGSQQNNLPGTANPVNSITSSSGKFLYVINQSLTNNNQTPSNSTISAFTIDGNGRLTQLGDTNNNPYATGSGPVCIVADPTNQYLYISNNTDSTVTGKLVDQNRGYLTNLTRGSVFPVTGKPTCLAVSGSL